MLATQAGRSEFDPQHPLKKMGSGPDCASTDFLRLADQPDQPDQQAPASVIDSISEHKIGS